MAIAFVQGTNNDLEIGATTIAATYSGAVGVGSFLICFTTWGDIEGTPTCSDSVNGAWTAVGTQCWSVNNQGLKCFYFNNTAAGTPVVTVSFGGSRAFRGILIAEYSGVHNTNPIDNSAAFRDDATAGTGTDNASTPAFTPTAGGYTVVAACVDVDGFASNAAGTNYIERVDATSAPGDNTQGFNLIDRIAAPSGSQQAFFTITNGSLYHSQAIVLAPDTEAAIGSPYSSGRAIFKIAPQRWG